MVINIDEAQVKYSEFIKAAQNLRNEMGKIGFTTETTDDIKIAAQYNFSLNEKVCEVYWNVPHQINFKSYADEKDSFEIDYVKNLKDWKEFLDDISAIMKKYVIQPPR
jgi:hypothetical protein